MAEESRPAVVYLDACCLNRPFDDQIQDRIRLESEAVLLILTHVEGGRLRWVASEVLSYEISRTPDPERRERARLLLAASQEIIKVGQGEEARAKQLEALGFSAFDALHLACAESGQADVLLTTDDRFLRLAHRLAPQLHTRVANPLSWLQEVGKE